ncbi:MAG: type 4a pilus biogenesis protein PilO [Candidatus Paceibacterota bacterium]
MKSSSKRITFIVISLILLLMSAMVYSSLIRKSYGDVKESMSQLSAKRDSLNKYQTTLNQVKSLLDSLESNADIQKKVSLMLPKDKDVGYLANQIIGLSKINGLNLESLSTQVAPTQPSNSAIIKNVGKLRGEVRLSGSYAGFKSFLKQIESNILILDVSEFRIEGSSKSDAPLKYTLSVSSYYQSD